MKDFVSKWILHNLGYKVVALVAAVVIWLMFSNMDDPIRTYSTEINVEVLHQEEYKELGRYLEIEGVDDFSNLTIEVYMRGRNSEVESLRNRAASSFLRAYVDLYELESTDANRLIIHYEIIDPSIHAELYEIRNKSYLSCMIEENVTIEIPVECIINGNPSAGYMYVKDDPNIVITPSTISLSGPANQISQFAKAQVTISVDKADANVNKSGRVILKNAAGETISYSRDVIWTSVSEATVFVPIYTFKTVTLQPYLTGSCPEGYEYVGDLSLSRSDVTIYGPESVLNKIYSLNLPDIEMAGITEAYEEEFSIRKILDELYGEGNVRLLDEEEDAVTINFTVEKQEETILTINTDSITVYGLNADTRIVFASQYLDITLYGLKDEISSFDPASMSVVLRLTSANKEPGTYVVSLEVNGLGELQYRPITTEVVIIEAEEDQE